ncbi:TonB-dependent receptor [Luteolibacter sp. LG18]|uniref:TonB-dependent receptor plug domain-containing protein n=1 Tax=Luteolibacter sp. LG18 TaxID=2819286 RepID=UPI002B2DB06E|nr:TonB-dependent receptor [Luteolibacter sp. LG18]
MHRSSLPCWLILPCLPLLPTATAETPADLGELVVEGLVPRSDLTGGVIEKKAIEDFHREDLAQALDLLPGVDYHPTGPRNEAGLSVRGFDLRQVPVLIDGIPVYVPYDGYADLNRFSTDGVDEIQVFKGLGPVGSGPNQLGGVVNIVSRRPEKPLEGQAQIGAFENGGAKASLSAGGREEHGYWQFSTSWIQQDSIPLSDDFLPRPTEKGGARDNSYHTDWRASGRIAWTPTAEDEYALGFWVQRGEKGNPPYTGYDKTMKPRYWQWPEWDKSTVYLLTKTTLDPDTTVHTKAYYDKFDNTLKAYDDARYLTQLKPSSFTSIYDDYTVGGSVGIDHRFGDRTTVKASLDGKLDHHDEMNVGFPHYVFEDTTWSAALEAEHQLNSIFTLAAGISHDWRDIGRAVDTNTGNPINGGDADSWNPQAILSAKLPDDLNASIGIGRKSRFPTIKDRYSYRLGQAIPNPNLQTETATHLQAEIEGKALDQRFHWSASVFRSWVDDAIQRVDRVAFTPGGAPLFQLQNVGKAEHTGVELSTSMAWTPKFETGVSGSWISVENRSNPAIFPIGTPSLQSFVYARWSALEKLRVIPSWCWADSRYSASNGIRTGAYSRIDLRTELDVVDNVTLGLGATNLLDRNQQLAEGFPEAGRTLYVDLTYAF